MKNELVFGPMAVSAAKKRRSSRQRVARPLPRLKGLLRGVRIEEEAFERAKRSLRKHAPGD